MRRQTGRQITLIISFNMKTATYFSPTKASIHINLYSISVLIYTAAYCVKVFYLKT